MCPIYVSNVIVECRAAFLHSGKIKRVAFHNTWMRSLAEQEARATPWSDGALKNIKFQAPNRGPARRVGTPKEKLQTNIKFQYSMTKTGLQF